jgi:hypothetical protein
MKRLVVCCDGNEDVAPSALDRTREDPGYAPGNLVTWLKRGAAPEVATG